MFTLFMLISHTIADFIIQSNDVVEAKSNMKFKGYLYHGLGLLLTSLPIFILIRPKSFMIVLSNVLIIIGVHLICDLIKEKLQSYLKIKSVPKVWNMLIFLCDQFIHIVLIIFITSGSVIEFNEVNRWFLDVVFAGNGITYLNMKQIFIIMYISFSGAYFIPLIFDVVYEKVNYYTGILNNILKNGESQNTHGFIDEVKTGKWIGILERILILIFLYSNQLSSIGFIIAAKSLARFKMLENKIFSEYYLLGTLFSVVYTFVAYSVFQKIL